MRRVFVLVRTALAVALVSPATGYAQSWNFYLGGFAPRAEDARTRGDVLVNNLDFLSFKLEDFSAGAFGSEWEFPLNDYVHGSLGIGVTSRSVPSVYADWLQDDNSEIEQDLKLRVVPFTATVRVLPLGRDAAVQPYFGAGVGIFAWRYAETGEFIDFADPRRSIFRDSYVDSGATSGPLVVGGLAFPAGSWLVGFEVRYQSAQGELDPARGFAGTKIDLGGFNYLAMFKVRF